MDYTHSDTIVALATAAGIGAIGVIRLSGKDALVLGDRVFGVRLSDKKTHTAHFGTLRDETNAIVDEALATVFRGPRSYTGEDTIEFSCHGSPYILQSVIELLIRQGARLAKPGEFTLRAFLNGKMDLSQAEAVADLIASESKASRDIAIRQMRGGIAAEIKSLRQELIDFASLIELELDFSEEDVEFANRDALRRLVQRILGLIERLLQSFQLGNAIKEGVTTVIAGRPNAGKSTLLNALLNEERAIVSHIAGTTRDTIEEALNIQGIGFRIVDTAGIREAEDAIEAIGVAKTLEKIQQSSILVYVFDVVSTQPAEVQADLERLTHPGTQLLVVANKMDLNPYTRHEHYASPLLSEAQWIPMSASLQMNLSLLTDKLYQSVIGGEVPTDQTLLSNSRHYEAFANTSQALQAVLQGLDTLLSGDLVALDIRRALFHLGEVTGEISTEDLLDSIFSSFCIGK